MNPFLDYVRGMRNATRAARDLTMDRQRRPVVQTGARCVLFSPHPDDECITGALPLRLVNEAGYQVINVPVTFGSNEARREARAAELDDACAYLGWAIDREPEGVEPMETGHAVTILERLAPRVVVMPAMADPNLLVELDADGLAELVAATALHVGEIARNPYHLLLPAWMQDNVRRGGELVSGQGAEAPDIDFATLYRLRRWQNGSLHDVLGRGKTLAINDGRLREIFAWK
jgi:hypothetical protein